MRQTGDGVKPSTSSFTRRSRWVEALGFSPAKKAFAQRPPMRCLTRNMLSSLTSGAARFVVRAEHRNV